LESIENKLYVLSFVFLEKEPFLEVELKHILSQEKYKIEKETFFENGPVSIKNMKVAERNNCDIVYNSEKGNLFVAGSNWVKVNEEFLNIKKILIERLELDLEDTIRAYELISDNQVIPTTKKPKEIIEEYYDGLNTDKFDEIFGEKSSNLMIRIVPEGKNRQNRDWYDLIIEPLTANVYRLRLVYRNQNIEKVEDVALHIEEKLEKIISIVGGV
jgi:acyl carrier protein